MAAITSSSVYNTQQLLGPIWSNPNQQQGARKLVIPFHYVNLVNPGTAGSATILHLPAGRIRVICAESKVTCSDTTATTTLSIGYGAYQKAKPYEAVSADVDAFLVATLISGPITAAALASTTGVTNPEFNSSAGVPLTCTTAVSDLAVNAVVNGHITVELLGV